MNQNLTAKQSRCSGASPAEGKGGVIVRLSCRHPQNDPQPVVYGTLHPFEQGNGGIQQFLSISQQPVPYGFQIAVNVRFILTEPCLPTLNRFLTGVVFIFIFPLGERSFQHSHDDIQVVMLIGYQDIRQFPMKLLAARTFQSADPEPDLFSTTQAVMPFAGIPVYQFSPAVRTNRCLPARE